MAQKIKTFSVTEKGARRCNHQLDKNTTKMKLGDVATCTKCGREFERVS